MATIRIEAFTQKSPFMAPVINEEKCADCGLCTNFCGYSAIQRL